VGLLTVQFPVPETTQQYQQQLMAMSAEHHLSFAVLERLVANAVAAHNDRQQQLYNRARDLSEPEPGGRQRFPEVLSDRRSTLYGLSREQV
jgi:hypothetical protein